MERKQECIGKILDLELNMFLRVRAREPAACQQDPEGFRVMRSAQFSVWPEEALTSYCEDLKRAQEEGRNLMMLKYARMEDLIPCLHEEPLVANLIDQIVAIELEWQREMMARYPNLMRRARPLEAADEAEGTTSFAMYLRAELETYSVDTLVLLHRHLAGSRAREKNLAEEIYLNMVRPLGYGSVEEAEAQAARRTNFASEQCE
ncbi:MAG: DUF4125 family protein [bacterium]